MYLVMVCFILSGIAGMKSLLLIATLLGPSMASASVVTYSYQGAPLALDWTDCVPCGGPSSHAPFTFELTFDTDLVPDWGTGAATLSDADDAFLSLTAPTLQPGFLIFMDMAFSAAGAVSGWAIAWDKGASQFFSSTAKDSIFTDDANGMAAFSAPGGSWRMVGGKEPAPVPLPAGLAMLGGALALLGAVRHRRGQTAA